MIPIEYVNKVLDIPESFGYPELIFEFEPESIAQSMNGAMKQMYNVGQSPMFCALLIFGCTMTYQIIPQSNKMVKQ